MAAYDEDLSDNKFFAALQTNCPELYDFAADNRWLVNCFITSDEGFNLNSL